MRDRRFVLPAVVAVGIAVSLVPVIVIGQTAGGQGAQSPAAGSVPRTPWGAPDLQGL